MKRGKSIILALIFGLILACGAAMAQENQGQPGGGAPPAASPAAPAQPGQPGTMPRGGTLGDRARMLQQRGMNRPGMMQTPNMNRPQRSPMEMFDSMDKNIQDINKQLKNMKSGDTSAFRRWFIILAGIGAANAFLLLLILVTLMKKNNENA